MDDLISRRAAIKEIARWIGYIDEDMILRIQTGLKKVPSAESEPKHGKWIDHKGLYQCSVCKHIWSELWWTANCPIDRMNKMMHYCPNCGAKMDEGIPEDIPMEYFENGGI